MKIPGLLIPLLILGAVSCGKREASAPRVSVTPSTATAQSAPLDPKWVAAIENLSPEQKKAWFEGQKRIPYYRAEEERDQREMVRPAPAGFKPDPKRKVKLTLIFKSTSAPESGSFWFKVDLQNVSPVSIHYFERGWDCFFKCGGLSSGMKISFKFARGDGKWVWFPVTYENKSDACPNGPTEVHLPGWNSMN